MFAREQTCGVERLLFKRKLGDQFSSRSRNSRGIQLKPGYQHYWPLAPATSSQLEIMPVLTFRTTSMLGWCTAGLKASAWSHHLTERTRCAARRLPRFIARPETC